MTASEHRKTGGYAVLWAACAVVMLLAHTGPGSSNDESRMALIESLYVRGVPWTEGSPYFNRLDMAYHNGHYYSDKSPALTLWSAATAYPLVRVYGFGTEIGKALIYKWIVWTSSGLGLLLLLYFTRQALGLLGVSGPAGPRTAALVLFGTALLPFTVTYCIYILESALIVGAFCQMLRARWLGDAWAPCRAAALVGLALLTDLMIGAIFLGLTGLYFAGIGVRPALKYALVAGLVVLAPFGVNKALYGEYRPFYTLPESYIYPGSYWLTYPVIPGLTMERLRARADALGMPPGIRAVVYAAFDEQQARVRDARGWIAENFRMRDVLTLGPVVFAAVWAATATLLRAGDRYRREALWALGALSAAYVGYLSIGVYVGECFGNRYLIPALPPLVLFLGARLQDARRSTVLMLMFAAALSASVPALTKPWYVPPEAFRTFNAALFACMALLYALTELSQRALERVADAVRTVARPVWPATMIWTLLAALQWALYKGRLGP